MDMKGYIQIEQEMRGKVPDEILALGAPLAEALQKMDVPSDFALSIRIERHNGRYDVKMDVEASYIGVTLELTGEGEWVLVGAHAPGWIG